MAYDPCGTQRLDGAEIIKRLATYLAVNEHELETALRGIAVDVLPGDNK